LLIKIIDVKTYDIKTMKHRIEKRYTG